jgi:holliday junction DNA helicase RuvA
MIAKLTGTIDTLAHDHAVIDVGGVGYFLRCSARTLGALPPAGTATSIAVQTVVRDDAIDLYGFAHPAERDWFRLLTTVQGVGPKVALALLSALSAEELAAAIASGDSAMLTRAEGVGPKIATRIANELKDKAVTMASYASVAAPAAPAPAGPPSGQAESDAISALINLGYRRAEAQGAIGRALRKLGPAAQLEALIPAGLKELGV